MVADAVEITVPGGLMATVDVGEDLSRNEKVKFRDASDGAEDIPSRI